MKERVKKTISKLMKSVSYIFPYSFEKEIFFGYRDLQGKYKLPINYLSLSPDIQSVLRINYNIKEVSIFKLRNVFVTAQGIVFKNFKLFLPSLAHEGIAEILGYTFILRQFAINNKSFVKLNDTVIIAHDQWSQNYYHWMIELLPRLMLLDENQKKITLILPEYDSEYMMPTLEALGYKNFYKLQDNSIIKAKTVLLPERTAVAGFQNPYLLQKLRLELLKKFSPNEVNCNRRIYVSRAKSQKRRLLNEQLIIPILEKYKFEFIYFEDLTFVQQIEMMRQTKVLVSVHGAGFTNMLFMQQGTSVVEMMNPDSLNMLYYRMATALELNYYFIPCAESAASTAQSFHGSVIKNDVDIEVNPLLLEEIFSNIF